MVHLTKKSSPQNRHLLLMVVYYCDFCRNLSKVVAPLTRLTSPKLSFVRSDDISVLVNLLKLSSAVLLSRLYPSF